MGVMQVLTIVVVVSMFKVLKILKFSYLQYNWLKSFCCYLMAYVWWLHVQPIWWRWVLLA